MFIYCKDCDYFYKIDGVGHCSFFPPTVLLANPNTTGYITVWPDVNEMDFCANGFDPDGSEGFEENVFLETYQAGWYVDHPFDNLIFSDDFESGDSYETLLILEEKFDEDWFTNNIFGLNLMSEGFDNGWFTESDYSIESLIENFEGDWSGI